MQNVVYFQVLYTTWMRMEAAWKSYRQMELSGNNIVKENLIIVLHNSFTTQSLELNQIWLNCYIRQFKIFFLFLWFISEM